MVNGKKIAVQCGDSDNISQVSISAIIDNTIRVQKGRKKDIMCQCPLKKYSTI